MAEGLFLDLLKKHPESIQNQFLVDSAGTSNYHTGELPDSRMRETALKHNINLTSKARTAIAEDLEIFDYIIAMDESNLDDILKLRKPPYKAKVLLMRDFEDGSEKNVPDPYFGGNQGFEDVYQLLLKCNTTFLNKLLLEKI